MTEKLTLQDCYKYPEAMIIKIKDAEITGTYKNTRKYQNIIAFTVYHLISDEMEFEISFCKLILRDISELTDKEKDYISKYFIPKKFIDYTIEEILRECASYTVIALIDYLRSINIDIDNFLKSGKAVKE